jgi:3-deoxy-manno-octulosonate cytidylyltransferase (CMP-KDO synthetase)
LTAAPNTVTFRRENCIAPRPLVLCREQVRQQRILGVIPARLGSERLPRKPLHPIAGRPLLEWVWRRVTTFPLLDRVVIATDAPEIMDLCMAIGADAVLTSGAHTSGTARVAEVVATAEYADWDTIVNVQGDEPFVTEEQVSVAVAQLGRGFDVGTVAAPVGTLEAWRDASVVKVVRRDDGGALYFSRSAIPHQRSGDPSATLLSGDAYLRHVGVYACSPEVLQRWVALPPAALEEIEKLEQLRALAAGLSIGVGVVQDAQGGVDTAADAERAAARLRSDKHT